MIATLPQFGSQLGSQNGSPSGSRPSPLANRPLPPSERDFEVYELVVIECTSTRAAAERFGVSQTRIIQIRDRVAEWIGSEVPPTRRLSPRQRVLLAADIAEKRIHFLLAEAVEAWRSSKGDVTTIRTSSLGNDITTTRHTCGDIRYLNAAARLNDHSLKLQGTAQRALAKAEQHGVASEKETVGNALCGIPSGAGEAELEEHREAYASRSPELPPVGDCSRTAAAAEASDEIAQRRREFLEALADDTSPVQPSQIDANGMLLEEREEASEAQEADDLNVLPLAAGAEGLSVRVAGTVSRPLSRKERRARQRMLDKLRRKAK